MIERIFFRLFAGGYIALVLLFICGVMLLSSCKILEKRIDYTNADEVVTMLESKYSGNFKVIETGSLDDGIVPRAELYQYGIPYNYTCHKVTNDKYPGLEFYAFGSNGGYTDVYSRNLYHYLAANYMETDSNFAFKRNSHREPYNCVLYYYDSYADIETAHDAVKNYMDYIIENYPFDEFKQSDNFDIAVSMVWRDDKVFNNFENLVFFTSSGSSRSLEERIEWTQDAYRSHCLRFEYGYEALSEVEQADYWEELAEKAKEGERNQAVGYYDFPIQTVNVFYSNKDNLAYKDVYGLSVGSFYALCMQSGLEVKGDSRAFEVVGANGSRYRFNYYFWESYEEFDAMQEKKYAECVYYKDGEAILMGDDEAVTFSVIEEVIGRTLVDSPD